MRQVVREFQQKADEADFVAVIDDAGSHTARQLLDEATRLAGVLSTAGTTGGTVLLQADNSWRTVAATLAVGLTGGDGGVVAVVNRHTTPAEFTAAWEDIRPDAVVAEPSAMAEWGCPNGCRARRSRCSTAGSVCPLPVSVRCRAGRAES